MQLTVEQIEKLFDIFATNLPVTPQIYTLEYVDHKYSRCTCYIYIELDKVDKFESYCLLNSIKYVKKG